MTSELATARQALETLISQAWNPRARMTLPRLVEAAADVLDAARQHTDASAVSALELGAGVLDEARNGRIRGGCVCEQVTPLVLATALEDVVAALPRD